MEQTLKNTIIAVAVGVVISVLLSVGITSLMGSSAFGTIAPVSQTETLLKWFVPGLYVGNAQQLVIDKSGNVTTTGSLYAAGGVVGFTTTSNPSVTTLKVSGAATVGSVVNAGAVSNAGISTNATTSVTKLCVYNGSQWTVISFSGVTPSYATSTTCL